MEKIFSIWWFFILIVVGIGVVSAIFLFYSADVDIRGVEVSILSESLENCITHQGILSEEVLEEEFDVFKECGLNKEIFGKRSDFYFNIVFKDKEGKTIRNNLYGGDVSLKKECEIYSGEKVISKNAPVCLNKKENVLYYGGGVLKEGFLEFFTVSNHKGGNLINE